MMKRILPSALCAWALLLTGCSSDTPVVAGGGGTETTNGVVVMGTAVDITQQPIGDALVQVRASSYLPDPSGSGVCASALCLDARTDAAGRFRLLVPDSVQFTVLFATQTLACSALVPILADSSTVSLDSVVLRPATGIRGVVSSGGTVPLAGEVRVFGMERVSPLSPDNRFLLAALPAGQLRLQITTGGLPPVNYPVLTTTGDTVVLPDTLFLADIAGGLAAYWPCDEGIDKEVLLDAAGSGLDGAITGAGYASGKIGSALHFAGGNHAVVVGASFSPPESGTVAFWFNADTIMAASTHRLISSDISAFEVSIRRGRIAHEIFALDQQYLLDSTVLLPRTWYHVACTWDYATHETAIYLDGRLTAQGANADDFPGDVTITLGMSELHGNPFAGRLDEVRIYRRVLDSAQIRVLAAGGH